MRTFPKARIDALTDGIFAFAMTLLVLEIHLPPGLPIHDSADLIAHLRTLGSEYLAYLISFFVLAAQWRGNIALRHAEEASASALGWSMIYLFFITGIPFSSSVVGHYGDLPPAVWLYAANMIVVAALSLRLSALEVVPEHRLRARIGQTRTLLFMATAAASAVVSLFAPGHAMFVYLLNFFGGPLAQRLHDRDGKDAD